MTAKRSGRHPALKIRVSGVQFSPWPPFNSLIFIVSGWFRVECQLWILPCFHFVSKYQRGQPIAARIVLARNHVPANIQRDRCVGVAHQPRYSDDVLAVTDHQARECVAQVMEPDSSQTRTPKCRVEASLKYVRVAHG
jgi:hypothetical protein